MTEEEVERLSETGHRLALRFLACAATASAADVARTGELVTPEDVRGIAPAAGELWAIALKIAADGATPNETELHAALVRDGKYVDDHGAVLQAAMLALSTTIGHPPMFHTAAADVLGLAYRLRMQSAADALADAAGRFTETDSFELLVREGSQIRDLYTRLRTLRGEP